MQDNPEIFSVEVTETAWDMLVSHARYLAGVSVSAASNLIDAFVKATDSLKIMPERNPWLENEGFPFRKYRKMIFGRNFIALYETRGETVYVAAVVDGRQDYGWMLAK